MSSFRFHSCKAHFTYQGHIPVQDLLGFLQEKAPLKWYSIVHETSDTETPYDHTHAAVEWVKVLDTRNPRYFDYYWTHPHIQKITNMKHAMTLYNTYHRKAPVLLEQSDNTPDSCATIIEKIKGADDLFDACQLMGIAPRSVSDVKILRDDKKRIDDFEHPFPNAQWTVFLPDSWRVIFAWGPTNTGKTMWATAQFASPLVVRHMDRLRDFDPARHDGIVFDDMSFAHIPREACIHLLDWDLDSDIHCRYSCARIPKHPKRS